MLLQALIYLYIFGKLDNNFAHGNEHVPSIQSLHEQAIKTTTPKEIPYELWMKGDCNVVSIQKHDHFLKIHIFMLSC